MKLIDILNDKKINVYHGTSFLKNAEGIINNGLQPIGNFITVGGGDESPSMGGRSYVGKELWNAIRYSFMMNRSYSTWEEFIKKEPYGYVFEFLIDVNTLLPDEDDIGYGVNKFLNGKGYTFYEKYLINVDKNLLERVKNGEFIGYAEIGKLIEPKLNDEDKKNVLIKSKTATVDEPIFPVRYYKIKKPNVEFFFQKNDYVNWVKNNKNTNIITL